MSDKLKNPNAFPGPGQYGGRGMTLRDYFAGQALVGFCSNISDIPYGEVVRWDRLSREAYETADAMLKERTNDK